MTCVKCHIAGVVASLVIHVSAYIWLIDGQATSIKQPQIEPLALTVAMFQAESEIPLRPEPVAETKPEIKPEPEPVTKQKVEIKPEPELVTEQVAELKPEPQPTPDPVVKVESKPQQKPTTKSEPELIQSNTPDIIQQDRDRIPERKPTAIASIVPIATPLKDAVSEQIIHDSIDLVDLAENEYRNIIVSKIEQNKFYPKRVRKMRKEGDVTVEFILNRNGSIQNMQVIDVTGPSALKKAALKAIKVSALFPPFPEQTSRQQWSFQTSLQYRLK